MIDPAMDWGGLKDSENAPNSFFLKINRTLFWRFGTDMMLVSKNFFGALQTDLDPEIQISGS